jgi:hypothetical protein
MAPARYGFGGPPARAGPNVSSRPGRLLLLYRIWYVDRSVVFSRQQRPGPGVRRGIRHPRWMLSAPYELCCLTNQLIHLLYRVGELNASRDMVKAGANSGCGCFRIRHRRWPAPPRSVGLLLPYPQPPAEVAHARPQRVIHRPVYSVAVVVVTAQQRPRYEVRLNRF